MLRKGKTKSILQASIDSALLAVEIYNKPRTTFRSESYITLMIMAWTRLFHAYFNNMIGDKYYYKNNNGRYSLVDGEKKSWELSTCIKEFNGLQETIKANLEFFIKLRNKIEHRHIEKREVDTLIFGECQSLLFNYESKLIEFFGNEYSINEALVYSLQFSRLRTRQQEKANRTALSQDLTDIKSFVEKYRSTLSNEIYHSLEYSIKLIQIPKISNTNRTDAAIEFVKLDELNEADKQAYEQITVLIKDKKITVEGANVRRFKPKEVVAKVNESLTNKILTINLHSLLCRIFKIRPQGKADDPFDTNTEFCLYDEPHKDYVYQEDWIKYLVHFFQSSSMTADDIRAKEKQGEILDVEKYRI